MPLYEYKCSKCSEVQEELRAVSARNEPATCGICGAMAERIMSVFNIAQKARSSESPNNEEATDNSGTTKYTGGAAIRLGGGSATLKNNRISGFRAGVSMAKGTQVNLSGNKFDNVVNPIEVTDD